jgi:hypothetical protein
MQQHLSNLDLLINSQFLTHTILRIHFVFPPKAENLPSQSSVGIPKDRGLGFFCTVPEPPMHCHELCTPSPTSLLLSWPLPCTILLTCLDALYCTLLQWCSVLLGTTTDQFRNGIVRPLAPPKEFWTWKSQMHEKSWDMSLVTCPLDHLLKLRVSPSTPLPPPYSPIGASTRVYHISYRLVVVSSSPPINMQNWTRSRWETIFGPIIMADQLEKWSFY